MSCARNYLLAAALSFSLFSRINAADPLGSGVSIEGERTPAEWLKVVKQQTLEATKYEAAHPEETRLLYGATQAIPYLSPETIAIWPAKYREGYQAYQTWWKSKGEAAFDKWRKAGFPDGGDEHYLIFCAAAIGMYSVADKAKPENKDLVAYGDAVLKRGREVLLKGCSGELLSAGDINDLRLFAMYDCAIDGGNEFPLPSYHGWMLGPPVAGDPGRDFTLPLLEEILARPTYSDANPFDEMHLFRPDILLRVLTVMTGYEAADAELKKAGPVVQERP